MFAGIYEDSLYICQYYIVLLQLIYPFLSSYKFIHNISVKFGAKDTNHYLTFWL